MKRAWYPFALIFFVSAFAFAGDANNPPEAQIRSDAPPGYEPSHVSPIPLGPPGPCVCPPGSTIEPDACQGNTDGAALEPTNGGCNFMPPTFAPIEDGETVCGEVSTFFSQPGLPGDVLGLAVDNNTGTMYAADTTNGNLLTINSGMLPDSGTVVGPFGGGITNIVSLAYDPDSSILFGVNGDTDELVSIDTATGAATVVGALGFSDVQGLAYDTANNTLIGADRGTDQLITIDGTTGAGTAVGALGFTGAAGSSYDPATDTLYVTSDDDDQIYTVDIATGAGTALPSPLGNPHTQVNGLAFDATTGAFFGADTFADQILNVDLVTNIGDGVSTRTLSRDLDWYGPIVLTKQQQINWTVQGNNAMRGWIVRDLNPDQGGALCAQGNLVLFNTTQVTANDCSPFVISEVGEPGTYYTIVAANAFGFGYDCGVNGTSYVATLTLDDPPPPPECTLTSVVGWSDDFDEYNSPSSIIGQGDWEGWDLMGPNAVVDSTFALSPGNSLKIGGNGVNSDIVRVFCDATPETNANVVVSAWQYVPATQSGGAAFIMLNTYEHNGPKNWSVQLCSDASLGTITDNGGSTGGHPGFGANAVLVTDDWAQIEVEVNLEDNTHIIRYDGIDLFGGTPQPWAGTTSTNPPGLGQIAFEAIDLFSGASTDFWYDDVSTDELVDTGANGIRGDFNGDGVFNGLVDGLGILNFFFIPGSPGTPCEDAADADGNGTLNGLVDGLGILNVAFIPGTPPLPAPFPECGELPDVLGCAEPSGPCNP